MVRAKVSSASRLQTRYETGKLLPLDSHQARILGLTRSSFWAVCWVDVSSVLTARNDLLAIAETFNYPAESTDEVLCMLANIKRPWLLILDNADDPDFDYSTYFPSCNHGAILMTSRIPEFGRLGTVPSIALDALDLMHATALLFKAAGIPETSWSSHFTQAQDIAQRLEAHTLALIQAGAYIAAGYCRFDEFLDRYQRHRKQLLEHYPSQQDSRYQNVYATFEASIEVLMHEEREHGHDALALLAILSSLHSSILPLQLFYDACDGARSLLRRDADAEHGYITQRTGTQTLKQRFKLFRRNTTSVEAPARKAKKDQVDLLSKEHIMQLPTFLLEEVEEPNHRRLRKACALLSSLSLVTQHRSSELDGVSMHPLVHAWARDRLDTKRRQDVWMQTASLAAMSLAGPRKWCSAGKTFQPHFQSLTATSPKRLLSYAPQGFMLPLLVHCGLLLSAVTLYEDLEVFLNGVYQALEISPWVLTDRWLPIWRLAATTSVCLRRPKLAVHLLEYINDLDERSLNPTDQERLVAQYSLSRAYNDAGEPEKAIPLLQHTISTYETLTSHQDWLLSAQLELHRAYTATGQAQAAVSLLEGVASKHEFAPGPNSQRDYLRTQHGLGLAYIANNQIREAIALLEHVVTMYKARLEETHPDRLSSQHELARAYCANKEHERALPILLHVRHLQSQVSKEMDYTFILTQYTLGTVYLALGLAADAVKVLEHVVKMFQHVLDEKQSERLSAQYSLALAYVDLREVGKAEVLVRNVVEVRRKTLENEHPHRVMAERLLRDIEDGTVYD